MREIFARKEKVLKGERNVSHYKGQVYVVRFLPYSDSQKNFVMDSIEPRETS
jgi:hypothetical protein